MSRIIQVFVSYSRHDNEVERVTALTSWLNEISKGTVKFVMDTRLRASQDVHVFERSISLYSNVLVIGTNLYKQKVLNGDFGVSREHNIIVSLLSENRINVFLAVMEDAFNNVFPDDLQAPLAVNLIGLMHEYSSMTLSQQIRDKYNDRATSLVSDIISLGTNLKRAYSTPTDINKKLFFEPKHEVMASGMSDDIFNKIFVKTSFYNAVLQNNAYLFVGRKGSGKSFLTDYFNRNPQNKREIYVGVHLRDYNLSNIYLMRSSYRISSEVGKNISQRDLLEAAWSLFFVCSAILSVYRSIKLGDFDYDLHLLYEVKRFADNSRCLRETAGPENIIIDYSQLIDWCIEKTFHYIDVCIETLSGDYAAAISAVPSFTKPQRLVPAIIGAPALKQFENSVSVIQPTLLITVDGFDTKFDQFRRETIASASGELEHTARIKFEVDWLSGLVEATDLIIGKVSEITISELRSLDCRFLVTLPLDRFSEVLGVDRDAYRLRFKQVEIKWSGIELMILLRKRLEVYYSKNTDINAVAEHRFNEALSWISGAPRSIKFEFNGAEIVIDLFCYFLRHTFWRPRDILYHVAELILLGEKYSKFKKSMSAESIRMITKMAAKSIIRDEFIGEFKSILPEIASYIKNFMRCNMQMSYNELFSIVSSLKLRLSSGEIISIQRNQIELLYEIGFLGIVLDPTTRKRIGLTRRESFSFSCRLDIRTDIDIKNMQEARWIIHPIFAEHLQLNHESGPFLLHYSIDQLEEDE